MRLIQVVRGTTKTFRVTVTFQGSQPNLTADVVTFTAKRRPYPDDPDTQAVIQVDADVTTDGLNGIAIFTLTPTLTNKPSGKYPYDIIWYPATGGEYPAGSGTLQILERVSDP
jgi:hypothetical protein